MTKGERLYKDMKIFEIEIVQGGEISYESSSRGGHGATLKKRDGSKFLDKRSTQVGGAIS